MLGQRDKKATQSYADKTRGGKIKKTKKLARVRGAETHESSDISKTLAVPKKTNLGPYWTP